jgi:chaperonin GroES
MATAKSSKINFQPTNGYVLIEPQEIAKKTTSGLYLPENATAEKPQKGKVLAVGNAIYQDGHEINSPAKVNEIVIYKKWGGNEVKEDGKDYMFVKFEDILAIVSK